MARTSLLFTTIIAMLVFIPTDASETSCRGITLTANETVKNLTSPNYPNNYPSQKDCYWYIAADSVKSVVKLKVKDFNLEGPELQCIHDYVKIYDGHVSYSARIHLLCGQVSNRQFTSSGNSMTVVFHSNKHNNFKGFRFEYASLEKPAVIRLFTTATPNYLVSTKYPTWFRRDRQWHITTGSNSSVVVFGILQFNLEGARPYCTTAYVAIYDGPSTTSDVLQILCGHIRDGLFTSTGSDMTIVFHSFGTNYNYNTFNFIYRSRIKGQNNTVVSPDYQLVSSDNSNFIITIATCATAVCFFTAAFIICACREMSQRHLRNTQSRILDINAGRDATIRILPITNQREASSPYVRIENSQNTSDPPAYSSLNLNADDSLPAYTPRTPGYNIDDLPPPYSDDLPGGPAQQK